MVNQREVYVYDLDDLSRVRINYDAKLAASGVLVNCDEVGWSAGDIAPDAPGWTYFPSSGKYFTIGIREAV